jgi:FKBP-type peptidyl-prolyl cis-trans isomerase SlpA
LVVSFASREGGELPGVVHRLMGDMVEIDFNHPLAGRDIVFTVEIINVESVSVETAVDV